MGYVGRFAPSPSGPLHLGSLVTALGSYLDAHQQRGRWLLRIEDLDSPRVQPGCAAQIQRTLESLGLSWDGAVEFQSRRLSLYESAIDTLARAGLIYGCGCTRRVLAHAEESAYPGTCRNRAVTSRPAALRFRVDDSETVSFTDRFQGPCCFAMRELGDVIVRRRDGILAYQLAVVIDDADQGITDVVRGTDLLRSTPWQLLLQRALVLPAPRYGHLPLVVEAGGAKLAKSRRSLPLDARRASQQLSEALSLLRHAPPAELWEARPRELLGWALAHWNPANLERVQTATAPAHTP